MRNKKYKMTKYNLEPRLGVLNKREKCLQVETSKTCKDYRRGNMCASKGKEKKRKEKKHLTA